MRGRCRPSRLRLPGGGRRLRASGTEAQQSVGYGNIGTIEMLRAQGGTFFLEVNTRLQVEHAVMEMITGLDLVTLMRRHVAAARERRKEALVHFDRPRRSRPVDRAMVG